MKKIAIISTHDDLCGIAGYTKALVRHLRRDHDITVFDLDQFLFRHDSKVGQAQADQEIERIAREIQHFDWVNIQLEHGTFGQKWDDIVRRITRLIEAAPRIAVTFHTIHKPKQPLLKTLLSLDMFMSPVQYWNHVRQELRQSRLDAGIFNALRKAQRKKPTAVIVHTNRDARNLQLLERLEHVFAHPLAFYSAEEAQKIRAGGHQAAFKSRRELPDDAVVIGCFGFIGEYKGLDTAIRALRLLPPRYHLAIFGGLHPNEIRPGMVNPTTFLHKLIASIQANRPMSNLAETEESTLHIKTSAADLPTLLQTPHPMNLGARVHFCGALSDDEFAQAMAASDLVLLPYLEVGQSSSGPMSIANDLGRPIVASRTKAFMQFAKFHPGRFHMFDVGNHLEMAQLIEVVNREGLHEQPVPTRFNTDTNCETYRSAFRVTPGKRR